MPIVRAKSRFVPLISEGKEGGSQLLDRIQLAIQRAFETLEGSVASLDEEGFVPEAEIPPAIVTGTRDVNYFRHVGTTPFERWYSSMASSRGLSASAYTFDYIHAVPYVESRGGVVDRISIRNTANAPGSVGRIGIYEATSATNIYPNKLIAASDEIDFAVAAVKTKVISATLEAGKLYYLVLHLGVANCTIRNIPLDSLTPIVGIDTTMPTAVGGFIVKNQTYAALPNAFYSGAITDANPPPLIAIRYSA